MLREGDAGLDGKPFPVFGAAECLERLRAHPLWERRGSLPEGEGVGVAIGWWPGGLEPAAASCRLDADGKLTIVTGAVDMSGTETVFQSIAAEAFGLSHESVRVVAGDTAGAPYAGLSGGSKVIYTVGRAVQRAAEQARERLLEVAATELEIAPEDLEVVDGSVRPIGSPDRARGHRRARLQGAAASAAPTRRSRATAAPRRPAAHRAPPPTCPTSASTARPAR